MRRDCRHRPRVTVGFRLAAAARAAALNVSCYDQADLHTGGDERRLVSALSTRVAFPNLIVGYSPAEMPPGLKQRLVSILAADAAGYSRLMAADETATVAALDSVRSVFRGAVETHGGRVVDMAGDSVLAVFDTATGAVAAALDVQRSLDSLFAAVSEERRLRFRIGVHLGDVIEKDDGTVYGDGVNTAARLQALAEGGGIVISDAVHGAVRGKLPVEFVDLGEHSMKNIPHAVRSFAVRNAGNGAHLSRADDRVAPAPPEEPSVAVLPFTNMTGDPEQDYFADGMVEEIITALARMRWLFVIARNSTFVYKGRAVDIKQVGRELGVRYVLEGSVRKAGNLLRITGQLIEASTGHHVWADRFEGTLDDVFELQDRMAERIVSAIEPSVGWAEVQRVRAKPASNLQAYDLLLRAIPGGMPGASGAQRDEALSFIRQALEKDPRYARAKAFGAFLYQTRLWDGVGGADDVKTALRYAEQALSEGVDDSMVLAYAGAAVGVVGYRKLGVRVLGFRYDEAERAIEHALRLSPDMLSVQFCAGSVRMILGDGDGAVAHLERAMRISPLDPGTSGILASTGAAHLVAGRYDAALAAAERALERSPNLVFGHLARLSALGHLGRLAEAKQAAKRLRELSPGFTVARYLSIHPIRDAAYRKRSAEILRLTGLP